MLLAFHVTECCGIGSIQQNIWDTDGASVCETTPWALHRCVRQMLLVYCRTLHSLLCVMCLTACVVTVCNCMVLVVILWDNIVSDVAMWVITMHFSWKWYLTNYKRIKLALARRPTTKHNTTISTSILSCYTVTISAVVFCPMAGFHLHWHHLDLSCANIFSSS